MVLLKRSILLQVCLLALGCKGQYESEYAVDEGEGGGDHSGYEESGHPDYSKYYSVDSAAGAGGGDAGFFSQGFSGFFGGPDFGASQKQETVAAVKNPFLAAPAQAASNTVLGLTTLANLQQEFPHYYAGGSNNYPKDYFEEAQVKQQREQQQQNTDDSQFVVLPGPNYVSHQIPSSKIQGGYSEEVETIDDKAIPKYKDNRKKDYDDYDYPTKYTDYNTGKSSSTVSQYPKYKDDYDQYDDKKKSKAYKDYDQYDEKKKSKAYKDYDQYDEKKKTKPYKDYEYEEKKAPSFKDYEYEAPKFTEQFEEDDKKKPAVPAPTPYQKYSFKPVTDSYGQKAPKFLEELISTAAPFNPAYNKVASTTPTIIETEASENVPSHLKGKNCEKIQRESGFSDEVMNCYVCEDVANKSKYTHCSYASEPDPTNAYSGHTLRYSKPGPGFRYKRYSGDEYSKDPYEYIKKQSRSSYPTPEESAEYAQFTSEYDDEPDKSFSEQQSEEITKNAENCIKEAKDGMTCTICKDPKTGGNFEQCSYTSAPQEQKYAYASEKKFNSKDEPEEGSESKPKETSVETGDSPSDASSDSPKEKDKSISDEVHSYRPKEDYEVKKKNKNTKKIDHAKRIEEIRRNPFEKNSKLIDDDPYEIPEHFAESTAKEQKTGVRGLEPSLYGSADDSGEESEAESSADSEEEQHQPQKEEERDEYKDIDEYHFKLFPEFNHQESQQSEVLAAGSKRDETSRKDVEEVLAEFGKKDRSKCKKAEKNGMTCYLCQDAKGIQHEECMYVSESKPQASHVAYHEVQQIKTPEKSPEVKPAASMNFFKISPTPFFLEGAASEEVETKLPYKPRPKTRKSKKPKKYRARKSKATSRKFKDPEMLDDSKDPQLKTPKEFVVGDEEGAFSAETRPVYSKVHGVKLPKYMIEKSEFEKEFDTDAIGY